MTQAALPHRGSTSAIGPRRRAAAALLVGEGMLLLLFWPTAAAMIDRWTHDNSYGHAFLILPVSLWLAWERRAALAVLAPRPSAWAFPPLAAAVAAWMAASLADVRLVEQLALVAMLQLMVPAVLGPHFARALAFPLLFLVFLVPMGDSLVPLLQAWTAAIAAGLLRLLGIPVFIEGTMITTPFGLFEVAVACSGLRFLTATAAVSVLFAHEFQRRWLNRALFVALCLVVAVLANGLRALGIMLLARALGSEAAIAADHVIYGWLFLSLVILLLLGLGFLLRERNDIPQAEAPRDGGIPRVTPSLVAALAAVVLAAAGPWTVSAARADLVRRAVAAPPAAKQPFPYRQDLAVPAWVPTAPGADATTLESFDVGGWQVDRYHAYFAYQRQGAEAVNSRNDLAGREWRRLGAGSAEARIAGRPVTVRSLTLAAGDERRLVWTWVRVGGRLTGDAVTAKLLQAWSVLAGGDPSAALIAVSAPFAPEDGAAAAAEALASFLTEAQ